MCDVTSFTIREEKKKKILTRYAQLIEISVLTCIESVGIYNNLTSDHIFIVV